MLDLTDVLDVSDIPGMDGDSVPVYEPLQLVEVVSNPTERSKDLSDDYSSVRKNLHFQQQMLMDAAKIFLETAKNADSPRHMEVFSTLMGQMTSTNKEILKLHKEMKDITTEQVPVNGGTPQTVTAIENAQVFIGSPTDLLTEVGGAIEVKNASST